MTWRAAGGSGIKLAVAVVAASILLAQTIGGTAAANIFTKILREAGESAGDAGKLGRRTADLPDGVGAHGLGEAMSVIRRLPAETRSSAVAATVSAEGHWTFFNARGERFTAAGADEISTALVTLAPEAAVASRGQLIFYLSEEAAFRGERVLADLPSAASIRLAQKERTYRLLRPQADGGASALVAEIRPNLLVAMNDKSRFHEVVWQLNRAFDKSRIRMLSLQPGSTTRLPRTPVRPVNELPGPEAVDPYSIGTALASLRGQTVVVTGKVEGDLLRFSVPSGADQSLIIDDLMRAAEKADVNLILLRSDTARQPGTRNFLWQRSGLSGIGDAMKANTFGDFLNALTEGRGRLVAAVETPAGGRVRLVARPAGTRIEAGEGTGGGLWEDLLTGMVSTIASDVITTGAQASLRSAETQEEYDRRIVPGIPSTIQYLYLGLLVLGLAGLRTALGWWRWLWPLRERSAHAGVLSFVATRLVRLPLFTFIFLPLVGVAAAPVQLIHVIWGILTLPWRWWQAWRTPRVEA